MKTPFDKANVNKDTFCMVPFMSMYIGPAQEVMPCCVSEWGSSLGTATSKESLVSIYNNEAMKNLRHNLVNGIKDRSCSHCWKFEGLHSSGRSLRQNFHRKYEEVLPEVLDNINSDYTVKDIKLMYLDIRFSNVCNLKCRSCGAHFSSMWHSDEVKLGWTDSQDTALSKRKIKISVGETDMLQYIIDQLPNVKEIYFAGGEPLIQDEHYHILDRILELGLQDKIEIRYNTNFSKLTHKGKDVIKYWSQFSNVVVGASLDGNHARGEYIRKGLKWEDAVENRKRMLLEVPHVKFHISLTLSIMNAYNVIDFHREWSDMGLIKPHEFLLNLLFGPECYKLSNLPDSHKEKVIALYANHCKWLNEQVDDSNSMMTNWIRDGYQGAIKLLQQPSDPSWAHEWKVRNNAIDGIRNEDFFSIFPEYEDLREMLTND